MINPYCTLLEAKDYATTRGQVATLDMQDDNVIEMLIESVSRYFDTATHRTFYPRYETRALDVPELGNDLSRLYTDDDLLEAVTVTNGNSVVITTSDYRVLPVNFEPKWGIEILSSSSKFWTSTSAGAVESAISIEGWWGFHTQYTRRGWTAVGTLAAAMSDTTSLTFTLTAGHGLKNDSIVKIGTEVLNVYAVSGANVASANQRGDNGTTAATHLISTPVYVWNVQPEIKQACINTVMNIYAARSGQSTSGRITVTASGMVIRPDDISPMTEKMLIGYTKVL